MQDKELEKILQDKAERTEMREFSQVWEEIKGEVQPPEKEKKFGWKKWRTMLITSVALVICLAFSPLIISALKPVPSVPPEEVFFSDDLSRIEVSFEDAFSGLSQANISHVDMSEYSFMNTSLYYTDDNQVKGASVAFYNLMFFAEMNFYDKSVDLNLKLETL